MRLVPVSFEDPDFLTSYEQSAELFACYQMAVHGDVPSECDEIQVRVFTCMHATCSTPVDHMDIWIFFSLVLNHCNKAEAEESYYVSQF